jgi:hypothetical protein
MLRFIYFIIWILIFSSCSTIDSVESLVNKVNPIYNIKSNGNASYLASVPLMTESKRNEIIKFYKSSNIIDYSLSDNQIFSTFMKQSKDFIETVDIEYVDNLKKFDSLGYINIIFDERKISTNSKLEYIYFWDYSNFRFLVPLLPLFNEYHKRNQCVNRAIESCYKNNMNTVVITPTLNHFKLYKNQ